jgi:hypothetical protein
MPSILVLYKPPHSKSLSSKRTLKKSTSILKKPSVKSSLPKALASTIA